MWFSYLNLIFYSDNYMGTLTFSASVLAQVFHFLDSENATNMRYYMVSLSFDIESAPQEIDEYDLVDPIDILTPLEKSGFWDGVVGAFSCFFGG